MRIISAIDFKNRLKVAAHAGLVACSLAISCLLAAGYQLINAAAGPYDPSSFAWPLYSMGIVIISILIGIALHSLVNRTYKPNSWHTALGGHFSITASLGIFLLGGNFEEGGGGFSYGLMQFLDNPKTVKEAIKMEIIKNNILDNYYIRKGQDAVAWGQDFSGNSGPFISPEMFREFALPAIKARVKHIKEKYKIPIMKHACGNNNKLLDMFVSAGYDSYMSIQSNAHMNLGNIKKKYGKYFIPWGGLPVELLVSGTVTEVRKAVKDALNSYKDSGRYIFGSSHSIAVGTKYDNFMVMIDEFNKNRKY